MSTDPTSSKAPDDIRAKSRCLSVHLVEGLGNFVEQDNAHQNNINKTLKEEKESEMTPKNHINPRASRSERKETRQSKSSQKQQRNKISPLSEKKLGNAKSEIPDKLTLIMKKSIAPSMLQSRLIEDALRRRKSSVMNNTTLMEGKSQVLETSAANNDVSMCKRNSVLNGACQRSSKSQERERTPSKMITPKKQALEELNSRIELKRISNNMVKTQGCLTESLSKKRDEITKDYKEKFGNKSEIRKLFVCSSQRKTSEIKSQSSKKNNSSYYPSQYKNVTRNSFSSTNEVKNNFINKLDNSEIAEVSAFEVDSNEYRTATFPEENHSDNIKPKKKQNQSPNSSKPVPRNTLQTKMANVSLRSSIKTQRKNSLLDTSLELVLDQNNSKSVSKQAMERKERSSRPNLKILSRAISSIHSRSSSVIMRSTFHTLNEVQGTPFSQQNHLDGNRSFSNLSVSVMNKRRATHDSICKDGMKRKKSQITTNIKTEPNVPKKTFKAGNIDNKILKKLNHAITKINSNTFTSIKEAMSPDSTSYQCCQAFFYLFSGLKDLPAFSPSENTNHNEVSHLLSQPKKLTRLISSYKDLVMRRELPKENVKNALLALAKMSFCESTTQPEGYNELIKFLTIAVEFFKSYNIEKPKITSKINSRKLMKSTPEKEFSSVVKYIQEDLFQGPEVSVNDNEKKLQIMEKVKEFQNNSRRSKSIDLSTTPQIKPYTVINKSNRNDSFETNSTHKALAKKIKKSLRTGSLDYLSISLQDQCNLHNHTCVYAEDFKVERLKTDIEDAAKGATIFRGKTKKLLFEHDRFVKRTIKQQWDDDERNHREELYLERARLLKYLDEREEDEKEFIEELNTEAIVHKRETNFAHNYEEKRIMEENIEESLKEHTFKVVTNARNMEQKKKELFERFKSILGQRNVKNQQAQEESDKNKQEFSEQRLNHYRWKSFLSLKEKEKWESTFHTLSSLIGDAQ